VRNRILSLLASTAALACVTSAAIAADLPAPAPPPPIIVPVFTWTGFYAGVNAGYGWRDNNNTQGLFVPPGTFAPPFANVTGFLGNGGSNSNRDGFVGGGQIGYNYQFGSFVVGVEADIQWADFNVDQNLFFVPAGFPPSFVPAILNNNDDMEWFGTVRARAGVAFDRFLIYATGGFAYSDNNNGWTAGGGIEWALPSDLFGGFASAATIGLEGLWVSLERDDNNNNGFVGTYVPVIGGGPVSVFVPVADRGGDNEFFVARAKLNLKFGTY
jgi:outer membrane immunogenic protein